MARDEARHGKVVEMVEKLDGHIKAECRMKKGREICPFNFCVGKRLAFLMRRMR